MNATTTNKKLVDEAIHAGCAGYPWIPAAFYLELELRSPTKWAQNGSICDSRKAMHYV